MESQNLNNDENKPTILTEKDIDKFVAILMNEEIPVINCWKCGAKHLKSSMINGNECQECWFKRFSRDEFEKFCKTFLE